MTIMQRLRRLEKYIDDATPPAAPLGCITPAIQAEMQRRLCLPLPAQSDHAEGARRLREAAATNDFESFTVWARGQRLLFGTPTEEV